MAGQVKRKHGALFTHPYVVHDTMVLSTVATGGMQENNVLLAFA